MEERNYKDGKLNGQATVLYPDTSKEIRNYKVFMYFTKMRILSCNLFNVNFWLDLSYHLPHDLSTWWSFYLMIFLPHDTSTSGSFYPNILLPHERSTSWSFYLSFNSWSNWLMVFLPHDRSNPWFCISYNLSTQDRSTSWSFYLIIVVTHDCST